MIFVLLLVIGAFDTAYNNRVKKTQLDAQLTSRQSLHISGLSRPIITRYKRMYLKIVTYYFEKRII